MYTTIITSSFRKSHPSIKLIETLLKSLYAIMPYIFDNPIIIAQDYHVDKKYEKYLNNLKEFLDKPIYKNIKIIYNDSGFHHSLVYNLENALKYVNTKYIWVLQDDILFFRSINITKIIEDMEFNNEIKYIRTTVGAPPPCVNLTEVVNFVNNNSEYIFEKDYKYKTGNILQIGKLLSKTNCVDINTYSHITVDDLTSWDYGPPYDDLSNKFEKKYIGNIKKGKEYNYVEAILYSDLVFLTTKEYMTTKVFGASTRYNIFKGQLTIEKFPEGYMSRLTYSDPKLYGIHVLAEDEKPITICIHIDGRNYEKLD